MARLFVGALVFLSLILKAWVIFGSKMFRFRMQFQVEENFSKNFKLETMHSNSKISCFSNCQRIKDCQSVMYNYIDRTCETYSKIPEELTDLIAHDYSDVSIRIPGTWTVLLKLMNLF